jgi:hypothetical protein
MIGIETRAVMLRSPQAWAQVAPLWAQVEPFAAQVEPFAAQVEPPGWGSALPVRPIPSLSRQHAPSLTRAGADV